MSGKLVWWRCEPQWPQETSYIVAGGPSVLSQPIELLKGQKVIAINSSIYAAPWADMLFFGDSRWYMDHRKAVAEFHGLVITTADNIRFSPVLNMRKVPPPPGLQTDRGAVMMRRTSLTAAINIAVHLGCKRIVLLGADGRKADDGRTHHHAPHKWPQRPGCWDEQKKDLAKMVEPLKQAGVEVLNASPGSAWEFWPIVQLADVVQTEERMVA